MTAQGKWRKMVGKGSQGTASLEESDKLQAKTAAPPTPETQWGGETIHF